MSKEIVEAWYNKIPVIERDQVLVICEGTAYSPNAILEEVKKDSAIGMTLQRMIETKSFTSLADKVALAEIRLRQRLSRLPENFGIVVQGRKYTPRELLAELDKGSKVARKVIESEITRVESVLT